MTPRLPSGPADLQPVGQATVIGSVVEFDDRRGVGVVRCADRTVPFHCTAITDGTRSIEVGTVVAVRIGPARLGRLEARSVRPLPDGGATATDQPNRDTAGSGDLDADVDNPATDSPQSDDGGSGNRSPGVGSGSVPPAPASPFAPIPAGGTEPQAVPVPAAVSEPSARSTEGPTTAAPGTSAAPGAPSPGTTRRSGPVRSDESVGEGDTGDESSPRPNFWSPFSSSPTGPPPTWSTPVTPREPPADGS